MHGKPVEVRRGSRHCDRGANLTCHWAAAWEGEGLRGSGSQETGCGTRTPQTLTEDEMSSAFRRTGAFALAAVLCAACSSGGASHPTPPPTPADSAGSAPPPPPGLTRIRQGGNITAAMLIKRVQPVYPPLARQTRISGNVRLHVILGKDGTVQQVEVISGHPLLVQAAMDAVRQWVYRPTLLNGQPVEVDTTVDVIFALNDPNAPNP